MQPNLYLELSLDQHISQVAVGELSTQAKLQGQKYPAHFYNAVVKFSPGWPTADNKFTALVVLFNMLKEADVITGSSSINLNSLNVVFENEKALMLGNEPNLTIQIIPVEVS